MALRVWLPLNGDLNNQGLDGGVIVTNNGATVDATGKIGSCYNFGDGTETNKGKGINLNSNLLYLGPNRSICAWVRPKGNHLHYAGAIVSSGNWNNKRWSFGVKQDNTGFTGFDSSYSTYYSTSIPVNTWTHLCVTVEGNITKFYKNGIYLGQSSRGSVFDSDAQNTMVGRETYASGYFSFNGDINDVRIYDHCLSTKEVKEISKGLVLHYKLDDPYAEPTTNLLSGTNLSWSQLTAVTSTTKNGDKYTVTIGNLVGSYTYATSRLSIPLTLLQDNAQYSVSFKYRVISGTGTINLNGCDWSDSSFTSKAETISGEYHYVELVCPVRTYNSTYHFMDFSWTAPNTVFEISDFQLEEKDHVTPYVNGTRTSTTVEDTSGYGNNGTITGQLSVSVDSPRYNKCILADGSSSYSSIVCPNLNLPDGPVTLSFWSKPTVSTNEETSKIELTFSKIKYFTYINYPYFIHDSDYYYKYINYWSDGLWHYVTCVYTGSGLQMYIDGNLISPSITTTTTNFSNSLNIKFRKNNLSDFRIYSTALSADDILELYNTAAVIDNGGTVYGYEFDEDSSSEIDKTGILKFNIEERGRDTDTTIYSQVQTNLLQNTIINNFRYERASGGGTETGKTFTPTVQLETNKNYTFSAMIRGSANLNLYTLNTGGNVAFTYVNKENMSTQEFKLFSVTFKVTGDRTINQVYLCTRYGEANTAVGDWFEVQANSVKLEEESMCTPWTPATSDSVYRNYDKLLSASQIIEY